MKKFYKVIDKLIIRDNAVVFLLKFLYRVFKSPIFISVLNILLPIVISLPNVSAGEKTKWWLVILLIAIIVVINVIHGISIGYQNRAMLTVEGNARIINYLQTLLKLYAERLSTKNYEGLFISISDNVCSDLYIFFKEVYNIDTRVSVIQQYEENKDGKHVCKCAMVSRCSKKTKSLGKKKNESVVKYSGNGKNFYYKKILLENRDDIIILDQEEIKNCFYEGKSKLNNIVNYVCIPQKAYGEKTAFLLQIDFLDNWNNKFDKKEMEELCEQHLEPIVRVMQNAYLIEVTCK